MIVATAQKTTSTSPETIFKIWADVEHWSDWDGSVQWSTLNGSFTAGNKIKMKPRGGPKTIAVLTLVKQNHSFDDVSHLPGATIRFSHLIGQANGKTVVTHTISMEGPMTWLWRRIMGKDLRESLQPAVDKLIVLAENSDGAAAK